jgi:hypothetical protein
VLHEGRWITVRPGATREDLEADIKGDAPDQGSEEDAHG